MKNMPLQEPVFKYYEYYPGDDEKEHYQVLVAFLPEDMMEAYNWHQTDSDELGVEYINKQLAEYGYSDDDIFFYFEINEYAKVIRGYPHGGDFLLEIDEN